MARTCRLDGCDQPVRGRRRYCSDDHAHEAKLNSQALNRMQHGDRYNATRRGIRAADSGPAERDDEPVVDFMRGGTRPPQFPGIAAPPAPPRREHALSDGRVPHPRDRVYRPESSDLTNAQRRDRYQVEREMVRQQIEAEDEMPEVMSWDQLQARGERMATTVDFSRSGAPAYGGMTASPYAAAILGQSVRRTQPPKPSGPRTPTIIP